MTVQQQPSFLLAARGGSHIRYFKFFSQNTSLNVDVVNVAKALLKPSFLRFWKEVKKLDLSVDIQMHLAKKRKKLPFLNHPPFRTLFVGWLRLIIRLQVVKYIGLISERNCDVVGVWNGQKMPSAGIAKAAKLLGKSVVYFENGLLPDTTTCDWLGVNCRNSLPREAEFYRQFDHADRQLPTHLLPRVTKNSKGKGVDLSDLPKTYVFVPFQVETDSQIISNSPWIKSMAQLYQHLSNVLDSIDNPDMHVVIKEHPSDTIRHDHLHSRHPRILFANHCVTQQLIEKAEAVLTINSTVGIESLLLGKPVMVLGDACYDIRGVALGIQNEQQLVEALNSVGDIAVDSEIRRGFLNFLHEYYLIPKSGRNADASHVAALTKRLLKQDAYSKELEKAGISID